MARAVKARETGQLQPSGPRMTGKCVEDEGNALLAEPAFGRGVRRMEGKSLEQVSQRSTLALATFRLAESVSPKRSNVSTAVPAGLEHPPSSDGARFRIGRDFKIVRTGGFFISGWRGRW
jgi:hypothetical protein